MARTTIDGASVATVRETISGAPADRLLERLADLVGAKATVNAVFGEPIAQGARTVLPVARVRWGFGGGGGRSDEVPSGTASWSGGGGGVAADPVGFLEIDADQVAFHPIREPYPSPAFLPAAAAAIAIVLRAAGRLRATRT